MTSLDARAIAVTYGHGVAARRALLNVSLGFAPGTMTLLKGPSGSGKTTLLSVIGGLLRPQTGRVAIGDEDLYAGGDDVRAARRRERIGFVFQQPQLFPMLRVLENVRLPLDLVGVRRAAADATAVDRLAAVGLADRTQARPRELSGGEQQRVAMARALVTDPAIVLADEPTASLDAANGGDVAALLRHAAHRLGKTVIVVSHDDRLVPYVDRIVTIADGQVVRDEVRRC